MYYYENHLDGGFYTSEESLSYDELYCEECGDSDQPLGYYENDFEFVKDYTTSSCYDEESVLGLCEYFKLTDRETEDILKAFNNHKQEEIDKAVEILGKYNISKSDFFTTEYMWRTRKNHKKDRDIYEYFVSKFGSIDEKDFWSSYSTLIEFENNLRI